MVYTKYIIIYHIKDESKDQVVELRLQEPSFLVLVESDLLYYRWIVVQPVNKNIKGRYLEKLGYWLPRQTKTVDRALIINKHRMRYWLGVRIGKSINYMLGWS